MQFDYLNEYTAHLWRFFFLSFVCNDSITHAFGRCCSIKVHSRYIFFQYHDVGVAIMLYPLSYSNWVCLKKSLFSTKKCLKLALWTFLAGQKAQLQSQDLAQWTTSLFNHTFLHKHETDTSASTLKHLSLLQHCLYQKKMKKQLKDWKWKSSSVVVICHRKSTWEWDCSRTLREWEAN